MRKFIFQTVGLLLLVSIMVPSAHATDEKNLENRIRGWISAVNEHDYYLCLSYVAPPQFIGGRGLTRTVRGGEELLFLSREELLPISEYKINKIEFSNNGYESRVTLKVQVIYQQKPMYIDRKQPENRYDCLVYPAFIKQRWILLNGNWFITSTMRIQYLGVS